MKTLVQKYEILETLGKGGFGTVYLARHRELGDLYAIKVLKEDIAQEEESIQRFKREAAILKKLLHPASVTLRDFGKTESGTMYMAMDFCKGESLYEILEREGALEEKLVLKLMVQMLDVLGEAHRLGIVHRDLKPENILIDREEQGLEKPKILDFGIATLKEILDKKGAAITREGNIIGTPLYMAPEQVTGKETDSRTDIYSLGMVMYSMLSGSPAFANSAVIEVIQQQLYQYPKKFQELDPPLALSSAVETLVFTAIRKEPEDRFQSAHEFKSACEECLTRGSWNGREDASRTLAEALSGSSHAFTPPFIGLPTSGTTQMVEAPRRGLFSWALFLLILLTGGGYFWSYSPMDRRAPQIFIDSPLSGTSTKDLFTVVKGRVENWNPQVALTVQKGSVPLQDGSFEVRVPLRKEGTTVIEIEARDSRGNTHKEQISLLVDRTPPIISIESPSSPAEVPDRHLNILGSISDFSPPVKVDVNGTAVQLNHQMLKTHIDLREGENLIEIRAVDALGNESRKTLEITGNLTCPAPKILSPLANTATREKEIFVVCHSPKKVSRMSIGGIPAESVGGGKYRALVPLRVGENTLSTVLWDNFGRTSESHLKVIREKPPVPKPMKPVRKPPLRGPTLGWQGEKMPPGLIKRTKRRAGEPPFRKIDGYATTDPKEAREYRRIKDGGIMVFVSAGDFPMGASEGDREATEVEKPVLFVRLQGYYIDKYEVTYGQFEKFVKATGYKTTAEKKGKSYSFVVERNVEGLSWKNPWAQEKQQRRGPLYPVNHISYQDAIEYTRWARAKLPTEAQWERAARGISGKKYPWGPEHPNAGGTFRANSAGLANPGEDGYPYLAPVGSYEKGVSPYGLFDMAGNVYEWCLDGWKSDVYRDYRRRQKGTDPLEGVFYSPKNSKRRLLRGGSWASDMDSLRCSFRSSAVPSTTADNMGFRCVVILEKNWIKKTGK